MYGDSSWSLVPEPDKSLTRDGNAGRRIISEMVSGALDHIKCPGNALSHEILTAELWFQRGESFYYGWDKPQSYEEAAKCYRAASDEGHWDATCNLGCLYALGLGVEKNDAESFRLFERAGQHGHAVSLLNLSHHYALGIGADADAHLADAYRWMGIGRNDPTSTEFAHYWVSKLCADMKLSTTEQMLGYDYTYRPEHERAQTFITIYEALLPNAKPVDHLRENENPQHFSDGNDAQILRKVRLVCSSFLQVAGQVLVLDAPDGPLTCGDVLCAAAFEAFVHCISNEGGRQPEGILIQPQMADLQSTPQISESMIVGVCGPGGIELGKKVHDLPRTEKIISSLYQRGLGVPPNEEEATNWHVGFSKRTKIGDHELCEPDHRQIGMWAEELGYTPEQVLDQLLRVPDEKQRPHWWKDNMGALVEDGCFTRIALNRDWLPVDCARWQKGFEPESLVIWGGKEKVTSFVPEMRKLKRLYITGQLLTTLDLRAVPALQELTCRHNQLHELDLTMVPALQKLWCDENHFRELDLSALTALQNLECHNNQLRKLDLSAVPALEYLDCSSNQLCELVLSAAPTLQKLFCSWNQLVELDLSEIPDLQYLDCASNQLCGLDLSAVTRLQYLYFPSNQLCKLDLSAVPWLRNLDCGSNQLRELDLSSVPALQYLFCTSNTIRELNITSLNELYVLSYDNDKTHLIKRPDQNF